MCYSYDINKIHVHFKGSYNEMFKNLEEIIKANKKIGHHFFDRSTMECFHSRLYLELYGGKYFITSERYDEDSPDTFTIREAREDGNVVTVSDHRAYASHAVARGMAIMMVYMGDRPLGLYKSMEEIKHCNALVGDNFFSHTTLVEHDRTLLDSTLYGGCIFITRELRKANNDDSMAHRFIVWQCMEYGYITELSVNYTLEGAKREAQRYSHTRAKWPLYYTIDQIKQADNGGHFFHKGAMRGFHTRVSDRIYGGKYFVTSERFTDKYNGFYEERYYTVRECDKDGNIHTVGNFDRLSRYKAHKIAKELGQKEDEKYADYYR